MAFSSDTLDHGSFFDSIQRPYTPSYNSTSGFDGAFSDQEDYWSGAGSQLDGVDFDFGLALTKGQHTTSFDYDPETADRYNNLEATLLAAQSFSNHSFGAGNQEQSQESKSAAREGQTGAHSFRESQKRVSITSPLLGAASSPPHTRNSSIESNSAIPTPALDQELKWMQSLGQRMSLREDEPSYSQLPPQQQQQQQQQQLPQQYYQPQALQPHQSALGGGHSFFAPVFEEDGGAAQDGRTNQPFPSYTYSQPPGPRSQFDHQQLSSGASQVPILSINDTAMPDDGSSLGHKQDGRNWHNANNWYSESGDYTSMNAYTNPGQTSLGEMAPPPSSTRFDPSAGEGAPHPVRNEPKRQDSYDPIRKFLRLDVDMGFVSQPQGQENEAASSSYQGMASRKRSNSDFGPSYFGAKEADLASPPLFTVVPGGVSDKTPIALTSGVDWVTEAARQRKAQLQQQHQQQQQQAPMLNSQDTIVLSMQQQQHNNGHSMNPNLLQQQSLQQHYNTQQSRYDPASGPMRQRDVNGIRGAAGPYHHSRTSSSGASNATPWTPLSPTVPSPSVVPAPPPSSYRYAEGSHGNTPTSSTNNAGAVRSMRRSQSASRHQRGAQSEDLSQLARSSNPTEFLNRITAPDGSLAPPNSVGYPTSAIGTHSGTSSLMNPFRTSHDRHYSTASNRSSSSLGSGEDMNAAGIFSGDQQQQQQQQGSLYQQGVRGNMSSSSSTSSMSRYGTLRTPSNNDLHLSTVKPPTGARMYSQTALPTYTTLTAPGMTNSIMAPSMINDAPVVDSINYPVVAQVTTSATQAASASRRKNEAIHICPIPGCGSTFTRKFNLNGHIRSHTGARPYECQEPGCGKSFARSFDLSRHEKLHAGIKPHNCESCGKAFARADALSRHLRNDAGNGGCAARFQEGGEDEDDEVEERQEGDERDDQSALINAGPTPRFRNGSSASSSLDSQDEVDRSAVVDDRSTTNDHDKNNFNMNNNDNNNNNNNNNSSNNNTSDRKPNQADKRQRRFKGYVL
ncbi:hypothetical protein CBS101457_005800 [Exobasidium rhododendri]|nr:hypothetical protein CBS101457_005800 [Exobasidium rhododendri]